MIRVEAVWLATVPLDMRAGTDKALAQVIRVFGRAVPHHADEPVSTTLSIVSRF